MDANAETIDILTAAAKRGRGIASSAGITKDYTADEFEFLKTVQWYKTRFGRPNPTVIEILAIVKILGYAKTKTIASTTPTSPGDNPCPFPPIN